MRLAFENMFNQGYMGGEAWLDGMLFAISHDPDGVQCLVLGARDEQLPRFTRQTPGVRAVPFPSELWWRLAAFGERRARRALSRPAEDPGLRWIAKHQAVDLWIGCAGFAGLDDHRPLLAWWPDFQHRRYPEYFGDEGAEEREALWSRTSRRASGLVVLTEAVRRDAMTNVGGAETPDPERIHVCPVPPAIREEMLSVPPWRACEEFGIREPYFVVSNQFWQHKNHRLVLLALDRLREAGGYASVVFTGSPHDYRREGYFGEIQALAEALGLKDSCRFLGVVSRGTQFALIRGAAGVIQPSRFEGQGVIVDESLTLGSHLLCSAIPAHCERAKAYPDASVDFFDLDDAERLGVLMERCLDEPPQGLENGEILSIVRRQARSAGQRFRKICFSVLADQSPIAA
jgi:glycosyltransferase involved in cell wall biosynthesis